MVYNRFFFLTLLRVGGILAVVIAISVIFPRYDLLYTQVVLLIVLVLLIVELTVFVNRTNYDLSRFITSVLNEDFTTNFKQTSRTQSFDVLHQSFNQFLGAFRELQTKNAAQFHFLKQLVDQIEFGIITFDDRDEIHLINSQAQRLLELPEVADWRKIKNPNVRFLEELLDMSLAKNELIETKIGQHQRSFSVSIMSVIIERKRYKIASFQDIRSEIQTKEIEAWHKLVRILTHEIMNSVTPMVSLTDTIQIILQNQNQTDKTLDELNAENISDINEAIATIRERSEGILKFITNYRKLANAPMPEINPVSVEHMIKGVLRLMGPKFSDMKVDVNEEFSDATLQMDAMLISQVMINLVKNAIEAMTGTISPVIDISTSISDEYYQISISDNGTGISGEQMEKVFVPFFTTKNDGSGIGLSISRQIMNLHGGYLDVESIPDQKTTFSLMFPLRLFQQ